MNQIRVVRTVALLLTVLMAGCQSVSHIKPLTEGDIDQTEYAEDIARLKQDSLLLHDTFKRQGLLFRDEQCNQYVAQLAHRLVPPLIAKDVEFRVFLVKNATPNAVALPNGDIYIFSGLMTVARNEDQLASVVAHEIGHVVNRHGLKSAINHRHTVVTAHITNIFLFGTNLVYLPAGASLASFSRDMEREADHLGLQYLNDAGYDVRQSPAIFEQFAQLPKTNSIAGSIYSSHPDNEERIQYLSERIATTFPQPHSLNPSQSFELVRDKMFELNVTLRLRAKQYQMALDLLEQTEAELQAPEKITYFRAETYRLMASNPEAAAREKAWLEERSLEDSDTQYFIAKADKHNKQALDLYSEIADRPSAPPEVQRGLGLIYQQQGKTELARQHLQAYLDQPVPPKDRLFIQHLLEQTN